VKKLEIWMTSKQALDLCSVGGLQALCPELSNQPILEVLLSMTLQCSGTACTSINSIINNCFVSGVLGSNQQD
jgi:hypothetical protein